MSIIQIEEVLSTAQELTSNKENTHQWLDENGWDKKITYVQDVNNNIYEATLSIANARDGRKILYDISTKKVDHAEGSQNRSTARKSTSKYSISQNGGNVNYVNTDNKGRLYFSINFIYGIMGVVMLVHIFMLYFSINFIYGIMIFKSPNYNPALYFSINFIYGIMSKTFMMF